VLINCKDILFGIKCLASGAISSGLLVLGLSVLLSKAVTIIKFDEKTVQSLMSDLFSEMAQRFMMVAIVDLVVCIAIIIIPSLIKKFKNKKEVLE